MTSVASMCWTVRKRNGWTFGTASPPPDTGELDWLALLEENYALPDRVKYVVNDGLELELRFEAMEGESTESIVEGGEPGDPDSIEGVLELLDEAGWTAREEDDKTIRVVPEGNPGTVISGQLTPGGGVCFSLHFVSSVAAQEKPGRRQELARALLLLRLGAEFRLVKPVSRDGEAGLEVSLSISGPIEQRSIQHALGSLTVAAQGILQEYAALANPTVAAAYLSHHRVSKTHNKQKQIKKTTK